MSVHHAIHLLLRPTFSGLYIFTLESSTAISQRVVYQPIPTHENAIELFLVVGEMHEPNENRARPKTPYWLTIPERGLFTGIAIFGAVGVRQNQLRACTRSPSRFSPIKAY